VNVKRRPESLQGRQAFRFVSGHDFSRAECEYGGAASAAAKSVQGLKASEFVGA
jgi:hypothetical protein